MLDFFPIGIALIGLFVGMLINYVSDILPLTRRLSHPQCANCGKKQPWIGYLIWPRRCLHCGESRRKRTWVVEIAMLTAAVWLWYSPVERLTFVAAMAILCYFAIVVVIDIEHRVIMHPVSLAGAVLAAIIGVDLHGLQATILGGIGGFGILYLLYKFGAFFAGWLARRRGEEFDDVALGFGDVNLAGVIGLLMGWPGITAGLVVGVFAGGIVSFFYLAFMLVTRRYKAFSTMPYGPYLVFGALALIFFRELFGG